MSDPITTRAFRRAVYLFGSGEGNHGILHMRSELLTLERQHNALIAKLEALANEWESCKGGYYADFYNGKDSGFRSAGLQIKQLIQEAKQ